MRPQRDLNYRKKVLTPFYRTWTMWQGSQNHGEAVYEIRSLSAVWNQHEVLNVINPKEDTRWRVMPYAFGDYILTCGEITCQSFGLDRKKQVSRLAFFLAPPVGLEPTTPWLTVMCSTDWAKEEYKRSEYFDLSEGGFSIQLCWIAATWAKEEYV